MAITTPFPAATVSKPGGFDNKVQTLLPTSNLLSTINNKITSLSTPDPAFAQGSTKVPTRPLTSAQIPSLAWSEAAYLAANPHDPGKVGYQAWKTQQELLYNQQQANAEAWKTNLASSVAQAQAQFQQTQAALALQQKKEAAGSTYADDIASILAGRNNYANAVNQQQDVIQQAALGGWTGTAGALAGQQKAAQLGATDVLQDRTAKAQDIFATNSAIAQRTQQALANDFAMNQQDFNRQVGYSQQILSQANDALAFATGQQKLNLQAAMAKYQNALSQYQNSASQDKIDDDKGWSIGKAVLGGAIAVASAVGAIFTGGATLPGVAVGAGIATS